MMKVGIVGMPNAGKSSLFNALSQAGAQAANYPFTTIEPNVAVVGVEDERLTEVARIVRSSNIVWDTIEFHDIAGLVAGAHKGEGLGNQFLANIRETDALLHVVRAHDDPNVIHPEGRVDPAADMDTIETELIYADLEQAERRHARIVREARSGDRRAVAEEKWLLLVIDALQAGRPVLEGLPPLGGAPSSLSFPSAHATASFACATAMTRIAPEAALLFILAGAIAVCRPYLGMHYPSDVLAGAILGTGLGLVVPL